MCFLKDLKVSRRANMTEPGVKLSQSWWKTANEPWVESTGYKDKITLQRSQIWTENMKEKEYLETRREGLHQTGHTESGVWRGAPQRQDPALILHRCLVQTCLASLKVPCFKVKATATDFWQNLLLFPEASIYSQVTMYPLLRFPIL